MKAFTYCDYIECIHTLRLNAVLQLAESNVTYKIKDAKQLESKNKSIKFILEDTKEMVNFINDFLKPIHKLEEDNIERYLKKDIDLIYRLKTEKILFLIEEQSTNDYKAIYKMLNSCISIMQELNRVKTITNKNKHPIIIPIIIYTGKEKWKYTNTFKDKEISRCVFENYKINLEYNLIDINKISRKYLIEKNSLFSYAVLLKKCKNEQELQENIKTIIGKVKEKEEVEKIKNMVNNLFTIK